MAAKKGYFVFHKEFYEIRKELGIKAWYELETYMLQLRFEGVDTDPQTIKNKSIKREWIMIRKKILDSIDNMNRQNKHRENEKAQITPKAIVKDDKTTEFDIPNCQIEQNTADLSHSKPSVDAEYHQQVEKPVEAIKTGKKDKIEINNNINNNMGTLTNVIQKKDGKFEKIEESNNKTITNDFSAIDSLIPKMNKEMALKQVKSYLSKEKNIGRLNDALSVFLNGVTLDDRAKYYDSLLEQVFAAA